MKHLYMAAAVVLLSGGLALAQGVNGATGPVGQGRGGDLGNPRNLTNRGNPQDLNRAGAGNPQDFTR
jgi:hypothetical protein